MISDTSSIYYVSEQCCFYTNWIVTLLFTVFCIFFFLKNKTEVCKALGKSVNEGNVIQKYLWDHRRPEL